MSNQRISQKDIARLANVSQGTVSAVLNNLQRGNTKVSDVTRRRILEIAEKHNYRPNQQARQLRGLGVSNLVGVFVNENISLLYYNILIELEQECQKHGLQLIIGTFGADPEKNRSTLTDFSSFNPAGVICLFYDFPDIYELLLDKHSLFRRVLFLDPSDFPAAVSGVEINYARGIRMAVDHLVADGHRRIAIFQRDLDFSSMKGRYRGYCDGLAAHGLAFDEGLTFIHPDYIDLKDKMKLAADKLVTENRADSVIVGNDEWAICLIKELVRRGLRVPEDVSVLCFADYEKLCTACTPELSAVQYDYAGIARAFIDLLNDPRAEEFSASVRTKVDAVLCLRESTRRK